MKIITKTNSDDIICDIEVSDGYVFNSELFVNDSLPQKGENNYFRQLYTDGLIVLDVSTTFDTNINTIISVEDNLIALVFHFQGNASLTSIQENTPIRKNWQEQVHNIEVINAENIYTLFEQNSFIDSFIVLLNKDFFLKLAPLESPTHKHLSEALNNNLNTALATDYLSVNQEMRRIIDNVRHCSRKGVFHRLCLELKITELLMLQLEQFHLFISAQKEQPKLNIYDQKKLDKAKEILHENYQNPPTIKELSSIIGLNESKLKSDFKSSFNSTIHDYTLKIRMETAYKLITESQKQIKEVSVTVGYQNASHFSAAFRKFFGFNPSQIN